MAKARKKARRAARPRRKTTKSAPANPGTPPAPGTLTQDLASLAGPLNVIAKSFAVVAMRLALGRPAEGERKQVGPRAQFLEGLGLEADDIAPVLGSTPPSVRELLSRARRKGRKRGRGGK
jgi:DNA-directed RNA polymerase specialized sigma24 family protein